MLSRTVTVISYCHSTIIEAQNKEHMYARIKSLNSGMTHAILNLSRHGLRKDHHLASNIKYARKTKPHVGHYVNTIFSRMHMLPCHAQ